MAHAVRTTKGFARRFRKLPRDVQMRLKEALAVLAEDPFHARPGADLKQLHGPYAPARRLRVGQWRITYDVDGETVVLLDVFDRSKGYGT